MCVSTEAFKQFLSEDFDVKDHANKVIQGMVITQQLGKLAEGISLLDKEIHTQVHVWLHILAYSIQKQRNSEMISKS